MNDTFFCERCGLPSSTKGSSINQNQRCSFCEFDLKNGSFLYDFDKHKRLFENRIESIRGKYEYDAIVGISGGKDGVYVLHRLVRNYGLKVLAATYDNEFLADGVSENIKRVIDIYQVDHYSYKPKNLLSLYRGMLKLVGVPCYACALGGYYIALNILLQKRIPLFIHGRSPFQMFRNLNVETFEKDPFFALVKSNLQEYDPVQLLNVYKTAYSNIEQLINLLPLEQSEKEGVLDEFFRPLITVSADFVPEGYGFFLTERYDEGAIRETLKHEASYNAPPSHHDCVIHNAANYMSAAHFGVSVDVLEAATMRRRDAIDKSAFESLLRDRQAEVKDPPEIITKEITLMNDKLNINTKNS